MSGDLFDADRHASEHARFALDDAAYALGALDPQDRDAFEQHLGGCPLCQAHVAELEGIPEMLAAAAPDSWTSEPPPASLLTGLLWRVESHRRRRRVRAAVFAGIAACLLSLLSIGGIEVWHARQQPAARALVPVAAGAAAVRASVRLTPSDHGTLLRVSCGHYDATAAGPSAYPPPGSGQSMYRLVVINRSGAEQVPTSWVPDRDITVDTSTNWPERAIRTIEIRDESGTAILRLQL